MIIVPYKCYRYSYLNWDPCHMDVVMIEKIDEIHWKAMYISHSNRHEFDNMYNQKYGDIIKLVMVECEPLEEPANYDDIELLEDNEEAIRFARFLTL